MTGSTFIQPDTFDKGFTITSSTHTNSTISTTSARLPVETTGLFANDSRRDDIIWRAFFMAARGEKKKAEQVLAGTMSGGTEKLSPFHLTLQQILRERLSRDPKQLSILGLFESIGIRDHNSHLSPRSKESELAEVELAKQHSQLLNKVARENLSEQDQFYYDQVKYQLEQILDGEPFVGYSYVIDQMDGVQADLVEVMTVFTPLSCPEDVQRYVDRLKEVPTLFDQAIERARQAQKEGVVLPDFILDRVIENLTKTVDEKPNENVLYTHLRDKIKEMEGSSVDKSLLGEAEKVIREEVYSAYQRLLACAQNLRDQANNQAVGVGSFPKGREYYQHCLKEHTSTTMTPEQVHDLGKKEVVKIEKQMMDIVERQGDKNVSLSEFMEVMKKDDRHFYSNSKEGRTQILDDYRQIIKRAEKQLGLLFRLTQKAKVEMRCVPESREGGGGRAYYCFPSIDGSRPGVFYVNLAHLEKKLKFDMESTAVHEAWPGHHLQIGMHYEADTPLLCKLNWYNAFMEGWALYTERLAMEQGFYSDDFATLGCLQCDMLRAVRLVIDTGLHVFGWSREKAISYMIDKTGYDSKVAEAEVDRYCVLPGQACSYKIGQLKFLELRDYAKQKLGKLFDIRDFHDLVLSGGVIPLSLLEQRVRAFVAEKKGGSSDSVSPE